MRHELSVIIIYWFCSICQRIFFTYFESSTLKVNFLITFTFCWKYLKIAQIVVLPYIYDDGVEGLFPLATTP
jgi:hypothetical protein